MTLKRKAEMDDEKMSTDGESDGEVSASENEEHSTMNGEKMNDGDSDDGELSASDNKDQFDFGSGFMREESEDEASSDDDVQRKPKKVKKEKLDAQKIVEEQYVKRLRREEEIAAALRKKRYLLPVKKGNQLIHRMGYVDEKHEIKELRKLRKKLTKEEYFREDQEDREKIEIREDRARRDLSKPVSVAEMVAWREKAIAKCRFKIGLLSSAVLEDPRKNVLNLKRLNEMSREHRQVNEFTVKKLIFVSMAEIYKDVIPSYQIRHFEDPEVKLKRETLELQNFEKSLLASYRVFLTNLEKCISVFRNKEGDTRGPQAMELGFVALDLICEMLCTHPYFNFSQNIAQLLILFLNNSKVKVRSTISNCISRLFKDDKKGILTLFIVRKINEFIKARKNSVHSDVIAVFLSLRIKDVNLDQEKEAEMREKKFLNRKQKFMTMSKKQRKASKKFDELERELLQTKAEENKQVKQKTLTEVIKVVFTIYFRILKKDPKSDLLCATLEGISKFAHLINLDFYQDLVYVLCRLMEDGALGLRQRLLCIQTVFTILSGYGESLTIDPTKFYTYLYKNMLLVDAGQTYHNIELVLNALEIVIVKRRKRISHQRLLAYTKRLTMLAMQLLHNGSLSCLSLVKHVLQMNKSIDILLEMDSSVGQGIYIPDLEDPEHCNAASTSLFELAALRRHYHPTVCKMAQYLMKNLPTSGEGTLAPEIGKLSSMTIFQEYDPLQMVFKPAVPPPKPATGKGKPHVWTDTSLETLTEEASTTEFNVDFSSLHKEVRRNGVESIILPDSEAE